MKIYLLFLPVFYFSVVTAQNIRKIAAYDNLSSYTSGLYCISDTSVFRYSWYYQEWFPLSNSGMVRVNDTARISAIAVYNNFSNNSSGLFVFSDSVVLNYNWILAKWLPLKNTGLPYSQNGKPDVIELTVYGDSGSSSLSEVYALTSQQVYRYNWYYQEWYSIPNQGLTVRKNHSEIDNLLDVTVFPNPANEFTCIEVDCRGLNGDEIRCAVFDLQGNFIEEYVEKILSPVHNYRLDISGLPAGFYFCEIKAGKGRKQIKFVKVDK